MVLFHEYAHHFMLQHFSAGFPAWYVEGFAEYFSTTEFRPDGKAAVGLPANHRACSLALLPTLPVKRMFAAESGHMDEDEISSFYAWAWVLTHYLSFAPDRKGQLVKYLKSFSAGASPEKAASDAFSDVAKSQRDVEHYVKARRMSYVLLEVPAAATNVALSPVDAADGPRRALELAPQVSDIRFAYAGQLIATNKRDEATKVLAPLLNDPHSSQIRATARAMLDPAPAKAVETVTKP